MTNSHLPPVGVRLSYVRGMSVLRPWLAMIIGRDLIRSLCIDIHGADMTIHWDDAAIPWSDIDSTTNDVFALLIFILKKEMSYTHN